MEVWDCLKNLDKSQQLVIVEESFLDIVLNKRMDESWGLRDSLLQESKEFVLIYCAYGSQLHLIAYTIEQSQCE